MQRELKNRAYIASTVSPLDDIGDSSAIDRTPMRTLKISSKKSCS